MSRYCGRFVSWYSSTITNRNCAAYLVRTRSDCSNSSTGLQQEIVEVEGAAFLQRIEIVRVDLRDVLVAPVPGRGRHERVRRLPSGSSRG